MASHVSCIEGCESEWAHTLHLNIKEQTRILRRIERELMAQQAELDDFVSRLTVAITEIRAEIDSLIVANPTLDLSHLSDAVAGVEGLEPPTATPAPTPTP